MQSEKKKMMLLHERRAKQAEVQKKIEYSNQLNQARLRVLKVCWPCVPSAACRLLSDARGVECGGRGAGGWHTEASNWFGVKPVWVKPL